MSLVIITCLTLYLAGNSILPSTAQSLLPGNLLGGYQHEIIYPSSREVEGSFGFGNGPVTIKTGFRLKQPPFLPRLPLPPISSLIQHTARELPPPLFVLPNLFTPNTNREPAVTKGQVENFNKAIEEQAKEDENQQNEITTDTVENFGESTGEPKSYVNVRQVKSGKEYNYNYSV